MGVGDAGSITNITFGCELWYRTITGIGDMTRLNQNCCWELKHYQNFIQPQNLHLDNEAAKISQGDVNFYTNTTSQDGATVRFRCSTKFA